jgi:hypothetical protein
VFCDFLNGGFTECEPGGGSVRVLLDGLVLLGTRSFGSPAPSEGTKSPHKRTKMKSEQINEITDKATEQLVASLNSGHSEALTDYLKAIGRFHRYSILCVPQHRNENVNCRTM